METAYQVMGLSGIIAEINELSRPAPAPGPQQRIRGERDMVWADERGPGGLMPAVTLIFWTGARCDGRVRFAGQRDALRFAARLQRVRGEFEWSIGAKTLVFSETEIRFVGRFLAWIASCQSEEEIHGGYREA